MRPIRSFIALAILATAIGIAPAAADAEITHDTITSKADGITIALTVFKPEGASADDQVPMILHSHGWSGSRTTSGMEDWTDAGFGVLSFDQRGHGETGGEANVEDPDLEGQDVSSVIDYIADLDWVVKDGPDDPVLGAIGGSYGGGYQTIGALTEIRDTGGTRFNALAPEITWNHLPRSLGPNGVPRALWDTVLYAAGAALVNIPLFIHEGYAVGTATGTFPDGSIPGTTDLTQIFYEHSPAWFADNGFKLDIPVLFRQGISDNLFPLNEAWHNYTEVLTKKARKQSILIGYNGGHVLPSVVPPGVAEGADECSGDFTTLTQEFFTRAFAGDDTASLMPAPYNLTTANATCVHVDSLDATTSFPVMYPDGEARIATAGAPAGVPIAVELAPGPMTVAGIPVLRGSLTTVGVEARAFFALSVGTSPADAQIIQNNVMPLRAPMPVEGEEFALELPGVAIEIPEGQSLFLTIAQVTDMFVGMGSRVPGAIVIEDAVVDVPLA